MKKSTLILLPGLLCDETVWQHQAHHLSDVADIIIPDLSGAKTFSEMTDRIMKDAPLHFMLAGHSMGGRLVFEIIKRFPDRIDKLCFLATSANIDTPQKKALRQFVIKKAKEGKHEEVITQIANLLTYNSAVKNEVVKMFLKNKNSLILQEKAMLVKKDYRNLLESIEQPTLVLVGRQDKGFFQSTLDIASHVHNAKLHIIENCGHMLTMEKPSTVTSLMRHWIVKKDL